MVTFYLVSISEAGSAKRPLNCYFCEAAALGNLPHTKGPELEVWNFYLVQTANDIRFVIFNNDFIKWNNNNNICSDANLKITLK